MPVESWLAPEETAACAAEATALIDATLSRLPAQERDAFWASVRKCYNTPYNDPKPRALPRLRSVQPPEAEPAPVQAAQMQMAPVEAARITMPMAAIPVPAGYGIEPRAS